MSEQRHIAFVAPRFSTGTTVGGAETLLKHLAIRAQSSGLKVSFLTTCATNHFSWDNDAEPGVREIDGLVVHFFPVNTNRDIGSFLRIQDKISRNQPVTDAEQRIWLKNNVNSDAMYRHLESSEQNYDRIVVGPYLFGLTHAVVEINPERTFLLPCLHDEAFAYLSVFGEMFSLSGGCLFNTEPERDLATRLYGARYANMPVVGAGMVMRDVDRIAFAKRHAIPGPYVIYAGRREPLKGTPLLLDYMDAFRKRTQRDIRIVLTGTGQINPSDDLAPYVHDFGFVSEQEKLEAMAGAVAFCHPSINESLGLVLLESWVAGAPAIVNARCAVLQHQCRVSQGGLWFRHYPDFEECLITLLDDPALRDAMGAAGREYVKTQCSLEAIDRRLLDALE